MPRINRPNRIYLWSWKKSVGSCVGAREQIIFWALVGMIDSVQEYTWVNIFFSLKAIIVKTLRNKMVMTKKNCIPEITGIFTGFLEKCIFFWFSKSRNRAIKLTFALECEGKIIKYSISFLKILKKNFGVKFRFSVFFYSFAYISSRDWEKPIK